MTKLPIHPAIFIPVYAVLLVASLVVTDSAGILSIVFTFAAVLLQMVWSYQSIAVVARSEESARRKGVLVGTLIALTVVVAAYGAAYLMGFSRYILGGPLEPILRLNSAFMGAAAVLPPVAAFWISARALRDAEYHGTASLISVVGTFLLYFYLILGAPFLYRRLRRLQS